MEVKLYQKEHFLFILKIKKSFFLQEINTQLKTDLNLFKRKSRKKLTHKENLIFKSRKLLIKRINSRFQK